MLVAITFLIYLGFITRFDIHRPTAKFEYLIKTQQNLANELELYVKQETKRLSFIRRYYDIFEREHKKAMKDIPGYVGNPINAFTLIKRLTSDVRRIKLYIEKGSDFAQYITRHRKNFKYPAIVDLKDAAKALQRFQNTYNLDIRDLSEGKLNGIIYSSPMTASDCYELGRAFFYMDDFKSSVAWMFEAMHKYDIESIHVPQSFPITAVNSYINMGYAKLGIKRNALEWEQNTLDFDSSDSQTKQTDLDDQKRSYNKTMIRRTADISVEDPTVIHKLGLKMHQSKNGLDLRLTFDASDANDFAMQQAFCPVLI